MSLPTTKIKLFLGLLTGVCSIVIPTLSLALLPVATVNAISLKSRKPTPLPKGIDVSSLELRSPTGPQGASYKFFANGRHEGIIYVQITANQTIDPNAINNALELYSDDTKQGYPLLTDEQVNTTGYSINNNGFDAPIPGSNVLLNHYTSFANSNTSTSTLYFKSDHPGIYNVCARLYTTDADAAGRNYIDTCSEGVDSPVRLEGKSAKMYNSEDFVTSAKYLSYYSWTPALNWMYDINTYNLTASLNSEGFFIKDFQDITGSDGRNWRSYGTNNDLIEGMGGVNDGKIDASGYPSYPLSTKRTERFNNSDIYTGIENTRVYQTGEKFYPGAKNTFYIGTYHGPAGTGNSGYKVMHNFEGIDNFGNSIFVSLPVCAGSAAYDGDCNHG